MSISLRKFDAWRRSTDFVVEIYRVSKRMPPDERFGMTSQIRRAAVSISSTIAEGAGRQGSAELLHYVSMASGSLREVQTLLYLMERLDYATRKDLRTAWDISGDVTRLLYGMRRKIEPLTKKARRRVAQ